MMEVYAVIYSNYDPWEVDSLWTTEKRAIERKNEKNTKDDDAIAYSGMWEVKPMTVNE